MKEYDIKNELKTNVVGKTIIHKEITESTNNMAKENSKCNDGTVFVADIQTAGRGRSGKNWISDAKDGLWMSILLKPDLPPDKVSCITLIAGLAVVKAMRELIDADFKIKWPNDIVLNKKKLCGILCEMSTQNDKLDYVICGIGINLTTTEFPDEISKIACSVFSETGHRITHKAVLCAILNNFEPLYLEYIKNGLKNIISEYKGSCITVNKDVVITESGSKITAKAVDITDKGELIVISNDEEKVISSGEVSVRGLFGYV